MRKNDISNHLKSEIHIIKRYPFQKGKMKMSSEEIELLKGPERVEKFLENCVFLGPVRFIVRNGVSILEAVGEYDNVKYKDMGDKKLASLISDDRSFECHIDILKVGKIEMFTKEKETESGKRILYLIRMFDLEGEGILTSLLHSSGTEYEEGAVEWWNKTRDLFGEVQIISS